MLIRVSPRPLTTSPFSVSEFSLPNLLLSECRSATRSRRRLLGIHPWTLADAVARASTAGLPSAAAVLRSARQVLVLPAALARFWQCWSAPASPPRAAPLPGPELVMKKLILSGAVCAKAGTARRIVMRNGVLVMCDSSGDHISNSSWSCAEATHVITKHTHAQ